ncbi:hypothetical protein C8F01DRAFT_1232518 [Mycena amicta]|nr:hypothetical protein C8F01DRAFT_1232518 [Mycena amicta]
MSLSSYHHHAPRSIPTRNDTTATSSDYNYPAAGIAAFARAFWLHGSLSDAALNITGILGVPSTTPRIHHGFEDRAHVGFTVFPCLGVPYTPHLHITRRTEHTAFSGLRASFIVTACCPERKVWWRADSVWWRLGISTRAEIYAPEPLGGENAYQGPNFWVLSSILPHQGQPNSGVSLDIALSAMAVEVLVGGHNSLSVRWSVCVLKAGQEVGGGLLAIREYHTRTCAPYITPAGTTRNFKKRKGP